MCVPHRTCGHGHLHLRVFSFQENQPLSDEFLASVVAPSQRTPTRRQNPDVVVDVPTGGHGQHSSCRWSQQTWPLPVLVSHVFRSGGNEGMIEPTCPPQSTSHHR